MWTSRAFSPIVIIMAMLASSLQAQSVCFERKLVPSEGVSNGAFGRSVDIDGSWAVIGSIASAGAPAGTGTVYVFHREPDGQWIEHQRLTIPDAAGANGFGQGVKIRGDLIALIAVDDDTLGADTGAVYVYHLDHATQQWLWEAKLVSPDGGIQQEHFGWSLALDEDALAISTIYNPSGKMYLMRRSSTGEWQHETTILSPTGQADDMFGCSIALRGDLLMVGAVNYGNTKQGMDWYGAICTFVRQPVSGQWVSQQIIHGPTDGLGLGASIAMSGDRIVAGTSIMQPAPLDFYSLSFRAYTMEPSGRWMGDGEFVSSLFAPFTTLGRWLALDGDYVIKGDFSPFGTFGEAQVIKRMPSGEWRQVAQCLPSPISPTTFWGTYGYGARVSIDNDSVMIADRNDNTAGPGFGAVYLYRLEGVDCNSNGTCDAIDISTGASLDSNVNGVPDECERIAGDVNGDGLVNVADLLAVVTTWGPCAPAPAACPGDIAPAPAGDGLVNVGDLLMVITNWGS